MKKLTLTFFSVLFCAIAFAQNPTSILTIFSEDGHKFYLILNGQKQNENPETNIRVENLTQAYYSCKIIFVDKTLGELSKSILQVNDAENNPSDVTYKIKAGKDGKQVLRYYSSNPITVEAPPVRPQGVVVYNFGVTRPIESTTTVTSTTTTQVVDAGTSTNVNVSGLGVNMTVNMPTTSGSVVEHTTTTTTTTSSTSSNLPPATTTTAPASSSACSGYAMAPGDYQSAKSTIEQASFEDSKLSTAKEIAGSNCLYASQVAEFCKLFSFENSKLDFAKYAYKRCIDPQNYFKVNNVFDFDASKKELSKYIGH
jgi:hypothetical protein